MVDFTLTDEQKDLRELAHRFAEREIRPVAWDYDRDGTWPQEIIEKAFEVGLMNVHIPEAYGGPGLDALSGCLIEEELGWGCSGIGTTLMANGLASAPLLIGASEESGDWVKLNGVVGFAIGSLVGVLVGGAVGSTARTDVWSDLPLRQQP